MRVVYMGTPDFAVPALEKLHEAGHDIEAVVTRADARRDRGKKVVFSPVKAKAIELGIQVLQPEKIRGNDEFLKEMERISPHVIVVAAYGRILTEEVLKIPKYGCLNIHGSLLPRYRGAAPIQAAIMAGDMETGITIMQMEEGLDTGDMLMKRATPIGGKTCGQLHDELALLGASMIVDTLANIENLVSEAKDDDLASYAPMIKKEDGRADFSLSPHSFECRMRAFDPWPGTTASIGDKTVKLWKAQVVEGSSDAAAGTVIAAGKEGIDVACGGGILRIKELQKAGKKRVTAEEYLRGNPIELGSVLG